jgi:hypothetical protein
MPKSRLAPQRKSKHSRALHPYKRPSKKISKMDQLSPIYENDAGIWQHWRWRDFKTSKVGQTAINPKGKEIPQAIQRAQKPKGPYISAQCDPFVDYPPTTIRMQRSFSGNLNVIAEDDVVSKHRSHFPNLSTTPRLTTRQESAKMAYAPLRSSGLVNSISLQQLKSPPLLRTSPPFVRNMISPTRIPTPSEGKGRSRTLRYVTAPAVMVRDRKEVRENIGYYWHFLTTKKNVPQKQTRLMGPISPSYSQPTTGISKSRTMGVLSTITSFSRNNLHLNYNSNRNSLTTRQSSYSSFATSRSDIGKSKSTLNLRKTAAPTTAVSEVTIMSHSRSSSLSTVTILAAEVSEEDRMKQVHEAMPTGYWVGRLSGLYNKYSNDMLEATLQDPELLQKSTAPTPEGYTPPRLMKDKKNKEGRKSTAIDPFDDDRLASSLMLENDAECRYRRAFTTLQGYCVTSAAKKSLWEFQQAYARKEDNSRFLPAGGHMTDAWYTKLTKGAKGDGKSERGTSLGMGRRTGLSRFGRSRNDLNAR